MSLRRTAMPVTMQLPHELSDILARNGMQASIAMDVKGQPSLIVQGHDSPVLTYQLTSQQLQRLTGWGSNFLNKQSYNTFADIVSADFDLPRDFVHARNVNSRVAMGLHGYRVGVGEYGRQAMMTPRQAFMSGMPMGFGGPNQHQRGFWQVMTPFLGWTDRRQDGYHLRRMGGMLVTPQGAPIIPERPDRTMRPGELQSGGYGFYWKGGSMNTQAGAARPMDVDPLQVFRPVASAAGQEGTPQKEEVTARPRSQEPAKPYKELITSDVYFTFDKFKECLDSHGLVLDKDKNELLVQSSALDSDLTYSLSKEDMDILTSNSLKEHSLDERLGVLNKTLSSDFKDTITLDHLNSTKAVDIDLTDVAKAELVQVNQIQEEEVSRFEDQRDIVERIRDAIHADGLIIPIISEKDGYHWAQEASHGRDVVLGNVVAYENEGKYYLRADVNGATMTKDLTQKEFQEIYYRNDNRRLELIDQHLDGIHLVRGDYKGEIVNTNVVQGDALNELTHGGKGWYREGKDGREVVVEDISVERKAEGKYVMTAQIDGQTIQHEISQKDFNRFLQMDDFHRMKLFSKLFDEVDIKNNVSVGTKVGAAIAATLTVLGEMSMGGSEPIVSMPRGEGHYQGRAYFKPGVDSPMDIAARNFEAAMVTDQIQRGMHH